MSDHGDPQLFRLHFKGAATKGHTLPAALPDEVIERRDLTFCNVRYQADPPLRFQVSVGHDRRNPIYDLRGDFGIELSAESRSELEETLDSTLDMLWEEYAQERPERLSGDACESRRELLERIRRTG